MTGHVPLSRQTAGHSAPSGPFDGVPEWLRYTLWVWVEWVFEWEGSFDPGLLGRLERELRLGLLGSKDWERFHHLQAEVNDPRKFLDVIHFLLSTLDPGGPEDAEKAAFLDDYLEQAGSVWGVGQRSGVFGLVERVDPTVAAAVAEASGPRDRSSLHLATAHAEAYGRDPNASHAYKEAVRAVEAIARPVVTPNDRVATLGKMISALRDKPEKWSVVLTPSKGDPVLQIADLMELLWSSEVARHGTDDESRPPDASIEEARAAVHIAATLVQLFRSDAIERRG